MAARYTESDTEGGDDGADDAGLSSTPEGLRLLEESRSAVTHDAMLCAVARKLYPPSRARTTFPLDNCLHALVIM